MYVLMSLLKKKDHCSTEEKKLLATELSYILHTTFNSYKTTNYVKSTLFIKR